MVTIAAVQMSVSGIMEENYRRSVEYIRKAAKGGAQLVCFPEGQLSHYVPQYQGLDAEDFAISLDHPYVQGLCDACRENAILGSFGLCLEMEGKIYACNMLVSEQGEILAIAKKNHIVQAYHFYEQDYFTPGQEGFPAVDTSIGKIGLMVCFDRHFPESFRTLALKGSQIVLVPVANERIEPGEVFQWEMRIPAFQNSMYTVMINRVGTEGIMDFSGETVIAAPDGGIAALAGDQEEILFAQLDLEECQRLRQEKQYLPLRRPEVFELN